MSAAPSVAISAASGIASRPSQKPRPEGTHFGDLAPDILREVVAPYLAPRDIASLTLVNRHYRAVFGDPHIWRIFSRALCLKPLENLPWLPLARGVFQKQELMRKLQESIDSLVKGSRKLVDSCPFPDSHCIALLATPELSPMHGQFWQKA